MFIISLLLRNVNSFGGIFMTLTILSDETIIELIIARSKELLNDSSYDGPYTVLTAFEETIDHLYYHGQAWKLTASNVDLKRFRAHIYSHLRHGIGLSCSVRASASSFYRNVRRNSEHDPVFIEELLAAEAERTEAIRKILGYQSAGVIDIIEPLLTYAKNHGGIDVLTYVSLFNYGYILGKRAERARRKGGADL